MTVSGAMAALVPILINGAVLIFGGGGCVGIAYWLLVIKRRKKWLVDIWEAKADGKIYIVAQDTLIRRVYNKGRQVAYILKNAKADVVPPPVECVHRYRNKELVAYLRMFNDYIPLKNTIESPDINQIKKLWLWIKNAKGDKEKARMLDSKYIYAPLNKTIVGTLKFEPMDYDLSVQMTNSMETLEKIYHDQLNFWQKYGTLIAIGAVVILVIVAMYMSYGYAETVIKTAMGAADKVSGPLNSIMQQLGGVTSSTPPA